MINTSLGCVDPAREEQEGNADALLRLIEEWQAEPGDYDERIDQLVRSAEPSSHSA